MLPVYVPAQAIFATTCPRCPGVHQYPDQGAGQSSPRYCPDMGQAGGASHPSQPPVSPSLPWPERRGP